MLRFFDGPYTRMALPGLRKLLRPSKPIAHQQTCPVCGRTLVNLYKRGEEWRCKKCWDKEDSRPSLQEMAEVILEHERACDTCSYQHDGCSGGVSGGPNGPIYPPCCSHDPLTYMEEDLIVEIYDEIMEEEKE